jgi:anti-sigma B factor antagonist
MHKRSNETVNFRIDDEGIDDATHVLELRGEMELHTAPEFKERVVELIAAGKKHIIVDISGATLGDDDGGLGVLVGAVKRLLPDDGSLALVCPDEGMMKVFEITGLHRVCRSYPSRAEALQALGGSPQRIQREAPEDVAQREAAEVEASRARRDAKQAADARARRKAETAKALRREAEEWWDQLESDPPSGVSLTVDQLRDLIRLHG